MSDNLQQNCIYPYIPLSEYSKFFAFKEGKTSEQLLVDQKAKSLLEKAINNTDSITKVAPRGCSEALKALSLKQKLEKQEQNTKTTEVKCTYKASIEPNKHPLGNKNQNQNKIKLIWRPFLVRPKVQRANAHRCLKLTQQNQVVTVKKQGKEGTQSLISREKLETQMKN